MINYASLYDDLFDILQPLVQPFTLIRDYQSDVAPADRYCTYRIQNLTQLGTPTQHNTNADGKYELRHTYSLTLRLSTIGPDMAETAVSWQVKLKRPSVRDAFGAIGLALYDEGVIKDAPRFVANRFEDKSIIDARFYIVVSDIDDQGWIEFIELEEKYLRANNSVIVERTSTIDIIP